MSKRWLRLGWAVLFAVAAHAADFKVGDKVEVKWGSTWYAAEVKAVEGAGKWKIGYDGYGTNWDEIVGPDRIRARGASGQTASANTTSGMATGATNAAATPGANALRLTATAVAKRSAPCRRSTGAEVYAWS